MRIDMRKTWKCVVWTGPNGETGHGLWLPIEDFVQNEQWCRHMDCLYPGWTHSIALHKGSPAQKSPSDWVSHPLYGDMEHAPMGLK